MRYHGKAFRKKVKVLWHGIVNSGSGAHPTVRAQDRKGRMTDPDCLRTRIRSSDDLAVLPPQSSTQMPFRGSGTRDVQSSVATPGFPIRIADVTTNARREELVGPAL